MLTAFAIVLLAAAVLGAILIAVLMRSRVCERGQPCPTCQGKGWTVVQKTRIKNGKVVTESEHDPRWSRVGELTRQIPSAL